MGNAVSTANAPQAAAPRRWVLIVGGVMTLGWLLVILAIATGKGNTFALALLLMWPAAIYWRMKTGPQLGPKAVGWITGAVDIRTSDKIADEKVADLVHNVRPGPSLPRMGRTSATQHRLFGWFMKRALLYQLSAFYCFVRPVSAGFRELGVLRAAQASSPAEEPDASGSGDGVDMDEWVATGEIKPRGQTHA